MIVKAKNNITILSLNILMFKDEVRDDIPDDVAFRLASEGHLTILSPSEAVQDVPNVTENLEEGEEDDTNN